MTSAASGGSPYSGTTLNTVTAVSPTAVALAPRTVSRCEASTPAARQSRPGRSSATTVTSLPSTIAAGPPSATSASWSSRSGTGLGHRVAVEHGADPAHQVGHQPGLPVVPRGRAGGQPVGDGERVQQLEQRPAADRRRDVLHGHRVVQVPAGGDDREQQVVADRLGDQLDVGLARARPVCTRRAPRPRRRRCGRRASPCRCRAAARRAAAGRAGTRRGPARRRWPRTRPGAGRP